MAAEVASAADVTAKLKAALWVAGRGLHSSTFQLNLSALYGIGGARGVV